MSMTLHRRLTAGHRGSAVVLAPVAVFVFLVVGAVAIDLSLLHMRRQQVENVAAAAANDAATAVADEALYTDGRIELDPRRATEIVEAAIRVHGADLDGLALAGPPELVTDRAPDGSLVPAVVVRLALEVDHVFAPSLPGGFGPTRLIVSERASLLEEAP